MKALKSKQLIENLAEGDLDSAGNSLFLDSAAESESYFLSNLVLNEVITTFEENIKFDRSDCLNVLHTLVYHSQIRFENRQVVMNACEIYKKRKIRFTDCLKMAVNQQYQATDSMHDVQRAGIAAEL